MVVWKARKSGRPTKHLKKVDRRHGPAERRAASGFACERGEESSVPSREPNSLVTSKSLRETQLQERHLSYSSRRSLEPQLVPTPP